MGKYRYKLRELKVGDIDINKGITTQVKSIDPETNSAEWDVKYNEDMGIIIIKLYDAMITAQELSYQNPDDKYFQNIADHIKILRNGYRAHIRTSYPREYNELKRRKEYLKEDEPSKNNYPYRDIIISIDILNNIIKVSYKKYYLKDYEIKNETFLVDDNMNYEKLILYIQKSINDFTVKDITIVISDESNEDMDENEFTFKPNELPHITKFLNKLGIYKSLEEESTSDGAGAYSTPFAFNKNKKNDGAPLKYYYRLGFKKVPTNIKGSGLEVKKLWK